MTLSVEERAERYLERNPDATAAQLAGALEIAPDKAEAFVRDDGVACEGDATASETEGRERPSADAHYKRVAGVYEELGQIGDWYCPGNSDFYGWYRTQETAGHHDGEGRAWALGNEFDALRNQLDRVVYSTVNYAPADWYMDAWEPYDYEENGREWASGDSPTPGYGDLQAYAPFADIDLTDSVKKQRPDGDIPTAVVENALDEYTAAFAELAGGYEHVMALDSVGGAYVFVAPMATAPIADKFDHEDAAVLFEDLTDRLNSWLDDVREDVNKQIPQAAGMFEPDLLNNKNRLYKAPMSIHSSLDGVVTPVDPESPSYEFTPLTDVSDSLIADSETWASEFTASHHRDAIGAIVETLWPDHTADTDSWQEALAARIAEIREAERKVIENPTPTLDDAEIPEDVERTDDIDVINAHIESIDVQKVAREVASEWDTAPGRDPPRFDPPWRTSSSGTSCYADSDKYVDLQEGQKGGGALKLAARAAGILSSSKRQLRGDDYWKAVNELRKLGFEVPYYTGKDGAHPDGLQLYDEADDEDSQRRQALRALRASKRKSG